MHEYEIRTADISPPGTIDCRYPIVRIEQQASNERTRNANLCQSCDMEQLVELEKTMDLVSYYSNVDDHPF